MSHKLDQAFEKALAYIDSNIAAPLNIDSLPSKRRTGFQIDLYSKEFGVVLTLRDTVATLLHGNGFIQDGHNVQHCFIESEISDYEENTKLYRIALTLNLYFD